MFIVIIRNLRTIVFCIIKITILRNTLCSWVTTRSQEILLRMLCRFTKLRYIAYRLIIALDCKYKQRRETAAKENAGEGIAACI